MNPGADAFFCRLFRAQGQAATLTIGQLTECASADDELAWIDLLDPSNELLGQVWTTCALPADARAFLQQGTTPEVAQRGEHFWVRCVVANHAGQGAVRGIILVCVAGPDRVVTVHRERIAFIDDLQHAGNGHAALGSMSAESFVATLLDRQLASYFETLSDYEMAVERLEVDLMGKRARDSLPDLQRLRRWASRLRRMLAPHRGVFGVMARPDFRPNEGREADRHFAALDTRFERAMDMVEHARELVIGSFELFSSQTALRTNDAMRVLTFVTMITGVLATRVGALGMNFQASFFKTSDAGFWIAVAGLSLFASISLMIGRRRGWF